MENRTSPIKYKTLRHILSVPFILGMVIPIIFLDLCIELYHTIAFKLYGLPYIKRADHIIIDRHKLSYLDLIDKAWCTYCGYANGVFAYSVKIAGETEQYWCAIKHKEYPNGNMPEHHTNFISYGDEGAFAQKYKADENNAHSCEQP